jgi:hypothetical protein
LQRFGKSFGQLANVVSFVGDFQVMKPFLCRCHNKIYFENTLCLSCESELGWCPACRSMTALIRADGDEYRCGHDACGTSLVKCQNYAVEKVCNRCLLKSEAAESEEGLCDYCQYNDTIPDLSVSENRQSWLRLEVAKRRLLYTLDLLRLPYGNKAGIEPRLSFDFKADTVNRNRLWWRMGKEERVFTGHADGKIVINVREADTVEREKARVIFQEAHRTLIGHFRHEIAHYYWQMLVQGRIESEFKAVFGDHENPSYGDAQQHYYTNGPKEDWQSSFISAYATMHPWEDFAETFGAYLDIVSLLDTALHNGLGDDLNPVDGELQHMITRFVGLGVVMNEMNRAMGLIDLVPEILAPAVVVKLEFIHNLLRAAAKPG